MKKGKQVMAIVTIVLLLGLYLLSFISAFLAKPYANGLFMASLFSTITIPILVYGFLIVYKMAHKGEDKLTFSEIKKKKKELADAERKQK